MTKSQWLVFRPCTVVHSGASTYIYIVHIALFPSTLVRIFPSFLCTSIRFALAHTHLHARCYIISLFVLCSYARFSFPLLLFSIFLCALLSCVCVCGVCMLGRYLGRFSYCASNEQIFSLFHWVREEYNTIFQSPVKKILQYWPYFLAYTWSHASFSMRPLYNFMQI